MNEYRQLAQWLPEFFEYTEPRNEFDGEWAERIEIILRNEGWHSMRGSEKIAFTSTKSPYVFKIGYRLQETVAYREFENYKWFRKWFPKHTLPTALVHERFLIQPKASAVHGQMPQIVELLEEIQTRYNRRQSQHTAEILPNNIKRSFDLLSFLYHRYVNYDDAHQDNFGLWRGRIRMLDFNGQFVVSDYFNPPAM